MTVDEIFSSESEHLYFRLIAARNALNAANDNETRQVLNEILDDTLNNISRIGNIYFKPDFKVKDDKEQNKNAKQE